MTTMTRAYSITTERLAAEAEASGGDPGDVDVSKVIALDDLERKQSDGGRLLEQHRTEPRVDHVDLIDAVGVERSVHHLLGEERIDQC